MRSILWLAVLASCTKTDPLYCTPEHHLDDDPACHGLDGGAHADVGGDHGLAQCTGPSGSKWEICADAPAGAIDLGTDIDTDTDMRCSSATWGAAGQPDACFIVATAITNSTNITIQGSRPLALVATAGDITIGKTLDAGSTRLGKLGAGARSTCAGATPGTIGVTGTYGGGGAGGTFHGFGGNGGNGDNLIGNGGQAGPIAQLVALTGGCPGTSSVTGSGMPGQGGGAVYLLAHGDIVVSGTGNIDASGAGGAKSPQLQGGSGAGSGGMIVLVATNVRGTGSVFANGGGGAGGAGDNTGHPSVAGSDPMSPTVPAPGGTAAIGGGGAGGNGYAKNLDPTTGGNGMKGGGGGGGGSGWVVISATASNSLAGGGVSPDPTTTLP